jgi:septal ring factor EnvC (AmiA/AmiB activator)
MDSEKIVSISLGLLWILGAAGGYIVHSATQNVSELMQKVPVLERRANEAENKSKYLESKLDNEQEGISTVLKSMQQLLSSHESQLAVIQQRISRSEVERKELSSDVKDLLRVTYAMDAKLNTFEIAE